MALENKIEVHSLDFKYSYKECHAPFEKKLGTILKADWTISVDYFRPFGWKLFAESPQHQNLKLKRCSSRAAIEIKCTGLKRQVFVEGIIRVRAHTLLSMNKLFFGDEMEFQHVFDEQNNTLKLEAKLGDLTRDDVKMSVDFEGNMKFYVNPENFFYFNFTDDNYLTKSDYVDDRQEVLNELTNNFEALFEKKYFTDVEIRSGSKVFPAHKAILSSRSPVFEAMFQSQMKETEEKVVDIEDIEPDIVEAMLQFMYSGKIVSLHESIAYDLFAAADKYQLPALRKACSCYLRAVLSVDNAVRTFAFADLHDAELKKIALNFICKEFGEIKTTPEWKRFEKEKVCLANEVLMNIIDFIGSK